MVRKVGGVVGGGGKAAHIFSVIAKLHLWSGWGKNPNNSYLEFRDPDAEQMIACLDWGPAFER